MKILLGIQPTGRLHIWNYFWAIKKGLEMKKEWHDVEFLIANYHANSTDWDNIRFREHLEKIWCKNIEFQNPLSLKLLYKFAHSERVAELERLPQYATKEKTLHMLSYPLLMACDIIISECDGVIVGDDQEPHMHYYREVARRHGYKEAITIKSDSPRIMSIKDPKQKMSKSLGDAHCIYLDETIETITEKIMKAPTNQEWLDNLYAISSLYGFIYDAENNQKSKEWLIKAICNFIY